MMYYVRALVYKLGFRPKQGSIFFSPTRDMEKHWDFVSEGVQKDPTRYSAQDVLAAKKLYMHHSDHGLPGHPCHELYSMCFKTDAELRAYRTRQREHGARMERQRVLAMLRNPDRKTCELVMVTVYDAATASSVVYQSASIANLLDNLFARAMAEEEQEMSWRRDA